MILYSNRRQRLGCCSACNFAACVLVACLLGCSKQETSTRSAEYFYEPDPINHGSMADVLPKNDSIAEMSLVWRTCPLLGLHTNEHQPWRPAESERNAIMRLFQDTQRVVVKERGNCLGNVAITDREGKKFRIDLIVRDPKGGEVYYVDSDSLNPTNPSYGPLEQDGHPLFSLFQKKSAEAKKQGGGEDARGRPGSS